MTNVENPENYRLVNSDISINVEDLVGYDTEAPYPIEYRLRMNLQRVLFAPEIAEAVSRDDTLGEYDREILSHGPLVSDADDSARSSYNTGILNIVHAIDPEYITTCRSAPVLGADGRLDTFGLRQDLSDNIAVMSNDEVLQLVTKITKNIFGTGTLVSIEQVAMPKNPDFDQDAINYQPRMCIDTSGTTNDNQVINAGLLPYILDQVEILYTHNPTVQGPTFIPSPNLRPKELSIAPILSGV